MRSPHGDGSKHVKAAAVDGTRDIRASRAVEEKRRRHVPPQARRSVAALGRSAGVTTAGRGRQPFTADTRGIGQAGRPRGGLPMHTRTSGPCDHSRRCAAERGDRAPKRGGTRRLGPARGRRGVVSPSAGGIVLVPFPFSDLSQAKLRPAVALADAGRGDWILCQVTSNPYGDPRAVHLTPVSFGSGSLRFDSYAPPVSCSRPAGS